MNYFNSRHFMNFVKNRKSIRIINQTNINRIKTLCSNILENKSLISIRSINTNNTSLLMLGPLSVKTCAVELMKVDSTDLLDNSGNVFVISSNIICYECGFDQAR